MAFTYTPFASDRDRVRFHIGDTDANAPILQDAQIDALLNEVGSWQQAVITALEYLIAVTSQPNFRADWLTIEHDTARRSYEAMLKHKRKAFGMAGVKSGSQRTRREDE